MLMYILIVVLLYKSFLYEGLSCQVAEHIASYPSNSLDLFMDQEFKPECCPSMYTKSSGCMCENQTIHDLLVMRGGNRMLTDTYVKQKKIPYLTEQICPPCDA